MPTKFKPPTFGTQVVNPLVQQENMQIELQKQQELKDKADCEAKGGKWDSKNKVCILPQDYVPSNLNEPNTPTQNNIQNPRVNPAKGTVETFTSSETGRASGVVTPSGNTYLGLSPEDVNTIAQGEADKVARPANSAPVGTAQTNFNAAIQAQQLQGQVGQFNPLAVSQAGLLDYEQAFKQGVVGAIPKALSYGVTGALAGGAIGGSAGLAAAPFTGGISAPTGAVIGAVGGFVSGIASSMISEFKGQRTDTINAQKRVLDEGKQNLNDWATMAAADPSNKTYYLAEYNKQLALIDQAYRQMKLDTNRDVAQFEKALPDLAEFEAFYSVGGERDNLNQKMRTSLLAPNTLEYDTLELAYRRGQLG